MTLNYCLYIFSHFLTLVLFVTSTDRDELLKQSPDKWPGHLEPFGSKQKTVEVPTLNEWPEPIDFFQNYIEKNVPVVFKGLAKRSPAYELFNDEFLKSFEGADTAMISSEQRKKEDRNQRPLQISFQEFIERYHNESLYLVDSLPKELRKYILMPAPLRCEETKELLSSQVTWFSSGGTKSVVHNDDVDNINCLYRGRKELLFVDYNKNKKFVPIDRPEGGYSSIDVEKVNYTQYPQLRYVDQYHHVTMEEGDCLFIPYHWFHQVNSVANDNGQNLAVNIWFTHVFNHRPVKCDLAPDQATLDKFSFDDYKNDGSDDEKEEGNEENDEAEKEEPNLNSVTILNYIGKLKKKAVSFRLFVKVLAKLPFINPTGFKIPKELPDEYLASAKTIFESLDQNEDEILNNADLEIIESLAVAQENSKTIEMEEILNRQIAILEDLFEDFVEDANQEVLRKSANGDGDSDTQTTNKNTEKIEL